MDIQIDIVEPDIVLFTKLSPSHLAGFTDEYAYYAEKKKILRRKHKNTYAIANADDIHQEDFLAQVWYGHDAKKSDLVIQEITEHPDGIETDFSYKNTPYHLVSPILGAHHSGLLVGAFLVALEMDIPPLDRLSFLRHIHLPVARGNILR